MKSLSDAQNLIAAFAVTVFAFLVGIWVGSVDDETETPPPKVEYVEVLSGDFNDVPLTMKTSMGITWRYLCDMHFTKAPRDEHTAECEHTE